MRQCGRSAPGRRDSPANRRCLCGACNAKRTLELCVSAHKNLDVEAQLQEESTRFQNKRAAPAVRHSSSLLKFYGMCASDAFMLLLAVEASILPGTVWVSGAVVKSVVGPLALDLPCCPIRKGHKRNV